MNAATKTKIANAFTAIVALIPAIQTALTSPPLTQQNVVVAGGVLAFLSLFFTAAKQWLSAEVSMKGVTVTMLLSLLPVLAGIGNLINIFHIPDGVKETINWWISLAAMIINILSKQIFPSQFQTDKNEELKTIDKSKTQ
jgi:hypothetical protein